ncbi:MAG: hypothetical protein RL026_1247 [Pseudomonadota bacterium]|jgi:iron complex transport system ATP-binding protein
MSLLVAKALCLERGGRRVLQGIDLQAGAGEFIALVGPNGAGKSSLLAVLAGLLKADQGRVEWEGRALERWSAVELAALRAYLPQSPRCEWPVSVATLVGLGLPGRAARTSDEQQRLQRVLADMDLSAHTSQPATTLSGGELARAMLARALVASPRVLLVDEPLAGLDPRHMLDCARRLAACARDEGMLVIAALHDLNIALRHATRLCVLRDGALLADGPPTQVLDAALLRAAFDVAGCVAGDGRRAYVDYA